MCQIPQKILKVQDEPNSAILVSPTPCMELGDLRFYSSGLTKSGKAKQPVDDSNGTQGQNLWPPNHTPAMHQAKEGLVSWSIVTTASFVPLKQQQWTQ